MKFLPRLLAALCCTIVLCGPVAGQSDEWKALFQQAQALYFQGKFQDSVGAAKKSLEVAERERGTRLPTVAASLNRLAESYRALGQFAAAEPLHKRALEIRERARGTES